MTLIKFRIGKFEVTEIIEINKDNTGIVKVILSENKVLQVREYKTEISNKKIDELIIKQYWKVWNNERIKLGVMQN